MSQEAKPLKLLVIYNTHLPSQVINIANLKYFEAGKIALELGSMTTAKDVDKSEASRIFHDWMIKLHQGQVSLLILLFSMITFDIHVICIGSVSSCRFPILSETSILVAQRFGNSINMRSK